MTNPRCGFLTAGTYQTELEDPGKVGEVCKFLV